ncbi:MAG: VWA domain-containing protein [Vicinamibacterales bacterium]
MLELIDLASVRFNEPLSLWLLVAPGALLLLWAWRLAGYRRDMRRFRSRRTLPASERLPLAGGLLFWLCLVMATACAILALARPVAAVSLARTAGIDLVILQDGSASMRVSDVTGNRWQRSIRFLRTLGESLRWKDDRIAMALFARIATPQIRLTKDPNTYYFFLDHLALDSPFRQEDDTTWDTNIELGIYWGVRLIDKDQELHGKSPNTKTFVLITDGQAWSGEVERSLQLARARNIPMFVVGVGTPGGGTIPEPPLRPGTRPPLEPPPPIHSSLDRASLMKIATTGMGQYLELDRETDRDIANTIIAAARRRAGTAGIGQGVRDLYWYCLFAAGCFVTLGGVLLKERAELWLHTLGAAAALLIVWTLTR